MQEIQKNRDQDGGHSIPFFSSMRGRLFVWFLLLSLLPLTTMGILVYWDIRNFLTEQEFNQLIGVSETKKHDLEEYLTTALREMELIARSQDLAELFGKLYDYHVVTKVKPDSPYDTNTPEYKSIYEQYNRRFQTILNDSAFSDIYLVCSAHGHVMFTAARQKDLGTNLRHGPYTSSGLHRLVEKVIATGGKVIVDYEPYAAEDNKPACFAGAPILDRNGTITGVMAVRISDKQISDITQNTGLGRTGETCLVGPDKLMRSQSKLITEPTILKQKVDTPAVEQALAGKSGTMILQSYRNVPVLTAFKPLDVPGVHWALLAQIDASEAFASISRSLKTLMGIGIVTSLIVLAITFLVTKQLTGPVIRIAGAARAIAGGDLSRQVPDESKGEMGILAKAFNSMVTSLQEIVSKLTAGTTRLSSSSSEISAATEEMSQGAESQLSQVLKTSSAMEEMSGSIREVSRNAKATLDSATAASALAREGAGKVERTIKRINSVNEMIRNLNRRTQEIGKVVQLIGEIAAQTNILALNAAIEAARAGEHGRGFDVVAEEIRKLAQRTTLSTGEISGIIEEIKKETNEAAGMMESGTTIANEAGQALEDIVEGIVSTTDMVQMIASTAVQQARTSEEIAEALQDISGVSKHTAQASKEVAKAIQDLTTLADQLKEITERFRI